MVVDDLRERSPMTTGRPDRPRTSRDTGPVSQANVETARRAFAAFQRRDFAAMLEDVHPDLITTRPEIDLETFHGPEGLLQVIAEWTENFREFEASDEEYLDAGDDQVIVRVRQSA